MKIGNWQLDPKAIAGALIGVGTAAYYVLNTFTEWCPKAPTGILGTVGAVGTILAVTLTFVGHAPKKAE